jgi:hypothetical protein
MFCWPCCHLGIILVNDQLDAQFPFLYVYFNSLHVSSNLVFIVRKINCINTTSGMCHSDRLVCMSGGLSVRLGIILVNDQHDVQFLFLYVYSNPLHVSSNLMLIIRRINCINTTSGMCHSDRLVCRSGSSFPTCILDGHLHTPDLVLIQLILLMMSMRLLETCREMK